MKRILLIIAFLASLNLMAQTSWTQFDKLMGDGSYKSAYALAEGVYNKSTVSADRLAAAYHMALAAHLYQEDAYDSAKARYRALLPTLAPLEKALCHAFLGEYDSALVYSDVLKRTPVENIKQYCEVGKGPNMTPTAFDVIVHEAQQVWWDNAPQRRLALQQQLIDFHVHDGDDLRIWLENRRLAMLDEVPNRKVTLADYQQSINRFRGSKSPYYTLLYNMAAHHCNNEEEYVQAVRYCDTAIQLAPKSEGGVMCANLRNDIMEKVILFEDDELTVAPGVKSLQRVTYRNLDHLWWRVIRYVDEYRGGEEKTRARLLAASIVESGEWKVEGAVDYRFAESYVTLPALKTGRYLLLVSPSKDFKADGFNAFELHCTDMLLVQNGQEGLLLDRRTGKPIVGQELLLKSVDYRSTKLLERVHTDSNGRYRFTTSEYRYSYKIVIERDGYVITTSYPYYRTTQPDTAWRRRCEVRTDRPIYKPGDTLQAALLCFVSDGLDALAAKGFRLQVELLDPNGQGVTKDSVTTDDFGMANVKFTIPIDRVAGQYGIRVSNGRERMAYSNVRVEEYKQPKFMVELGIRNEELGMEAAQFGQPYTVRGLAASYSAVPISGAKVQYTVMRTEMSCYRWHWYGTGNDVNVAEGELTTAADGSFDIVFTPEPDSNSNLEAKPVYLFMVKAEVTDLNGESHEESYTMRVGFRNAFLALDGEEEVCTLNGLKPRYFDLNGNPLDGKVDMRIDRLWLPATPLLDPPVMVKGAHHTMDFDEFRKAFPLYTYSEDWNDRDTWLAVAEDGKRKDASGVYRITLTAPDADTVVAYRVVTTPDARKVQSQQLLWAEVDKQRAEVGETVRLRFGSRFYDVEVYYLLRIGNEERDFRRITVSDELKYIDIPVDSAMLGGFNIDLVAVREGVNVSWGQSVEVPFSHKQLKVEIATFRDRLLPGETEEWTIKVKGEMSDVRRETTGDSQVSPLKSHLILTMYDDALNSYGGVNRWDFSPWRHNWSSGIDIERLYSGTGYWIITPQELNYRGLHPLCWTLKDALLNYSPWRARMYKSAANNVVTTSFEVVEDEVEEVQIFAEKVPVVEIGAPESGQRLTADDIARMPGTSLESVVAAVGGIGYSDGGNGTAQRVQVRTHLNTLAFFAPNLRTDADGTLTYRFTVPELLTRWNVKGLAVTKDIKIGTLDKTLVTSKPLMVQPNMPRFLRQGDSLSLMAKVVLKEELRIKNEELPVEVMFVLTDAATGDTLCHHTEQVMVKDAAQVMFDVEVPQHVYVATYKIVASTDGMSDGEQGQVPVVTNRQAVTVSQAMYINGAGEKHYTLPEWLVKSDTREPHLVAAEVVSNPVWLAIKSMPYLKQQENPSTLYLANQLYVNRLGLDIIEKLDVLENIEKLDGSSRLKMNEDVKQTLLQATPWVRDAESEEEQMVAVKHYFDTVSLKQSSNQVIKQLQERQNNDGGWSWMPEGKSSLWVTQQVLKKVKGERLKVNEALAYVDREQQRYYEKYIKPYLKKGYTWTPTDIDYLYTRSFYGKAETEAYKYYYANALKRYKDYENLYTQAQLALIFHRHGDKKQALDLLRRIKEKSLTSDEMGMYWRDNKSGWFWYQRPIETQALLIQAFAEITPNDTETIGLMQQWLLKQKQTTHWGNDVATTEAIKALVCGEQRVGDGERRVELTVLGEPMTAEVQGMEGYRSQRWTGGALDTLSAHHSSEITLKKQDDGIAWGAVYYQYTDDMDKIPSSEIGITVKRSYTNLSNPNNTSTPKVGDKIKVHIDITCDRTMEYLELIDGRPSCVEPLSTRAGWRWSDGLSYYIVVNNTDTRCYIDRLEKGKYYLEYEVYVTNPGHFLAGPVTMQCMYAPEFRATAPAQSIEIINH